MTTPTQAPCPTCGYNGPGFYQPETHKCMAAAPTQAQIEAARRAVAICLKAGGSLDDCLSAALTAAAEREMYERELACTAAADPMGPWDARYSGSAKEIEYHTIERCAQVVLNCGIGSIKDRQKIAAEIRALKDKP